MKKYTRVYETVNLDAIRHNMEAMRANLTEGTKMMGVVKADGYGHGSVPVAIAIDPYVWGYGVATVEEGCILRNHGIKKPILVLGIVPQDGYDAVIEQDISPACFQTKQAEKLSRLAREAGKTVKLHLAVDTGMSRIGFSPTEKGADEAAYICGLPAIEAVGMFTHFARADEGDKEPALRQLKLFKAFASMLKERGITIPFLHCSNSAGILDLKTANLNGVRAGISIYGLYPSDEVGRDRVRLMAAMELKSHISCIKNIKEGARVSYGGTFQAKRDMTIATIPVGYGDGYPRALSGKGQVLICGKRAPILGRVCMDQFMADISHIPEAAEEEEVILIGKAGKEEITVEELAGLSGGFHYEILCGIGKRVPRVYVEHGRVIGTKDYFTDSYEGFSMR